MPGFGGILEDAPAVAPVALSGRTQALHRVQKLLSIRCSDAVVDTTRTGPRSLSPCSGSTGKGQYIEGVRSGPLPFCSFRPRSATAVIRRAEAANACAAGRPKS